MVWYEEDPKVAYAWIGVIQRDYQNNNIGTLLFDYFLKDMTNSGYEKVWAKVGRDNIKALKLFKKYDFTISRWKENNKILITEKNLY